MSFLRFTTLTALAIIPWSIIFIYLGEKLGENWENINDIAGPYVKSFAIGGVVLIVLYFVIKMDKKRKILRKIYNKNRYTFITNVSGFNIGLILY